MAQTASSVKERTFVEDLLEKSIDVISMIGPAYTHYSREVSELRDRFAAGRFHLAVLGQFKRGKSTLLNALAGEPVLPVGVVPLTAAPTFIAFGETPTVRIAYQDDRPAETFAGNSTKERAAYLAGFVSEKENPQNRRGVAEVQVVLPAPILSGGVVLIDTPGIGSTYRHNTTTTLNFLQQCDAALFLVSADPPITEVELEFLRQVKGKVPRLFFVLNKIDYLNDDEREEALSFYKRVLAEENVWDSDSPVFCVSARQGLEAKEAADSDRWRSSGMEKLESFLADFLAREKFNALTEAVSYRAVNIIEAVLMEIGIAREALQIPQQELAEKLAVFEDSLKRASVERRLIQDVLEGDKKRVTAFVEEEARQMRVEAEQFLKEVMQQSAIPRGGGSAKSNIQEAWAEAIPGYFEELRRTFNEKVKSFLMDCLEPHEERLTRLVETLRQTAADLFRVPYRPLAREETLEIRRRPYWVLSSWNTDPLPMLQSLDQRLDGLVRRNVENIRWSMLQNLTISFAGFARRIRERLDETVAATKGAMESAQAQREAGSDGIAAEVARMTERMTILDGLKKEFAACKPEKSGSFKS